MNPEEIYPEKKWGFIKFCLNEKHGIPFERIFINRELKQVSILGEVVIKTNTDGSIKYLRYEEINQRLASLI